MAALCPTGHASDEPDYCSVCGARIGDARCPSCGEPRADASARFCEICRHDFVENRPGPPPVSRPPGARAWELVISVDPALDTDPDPAFPCPRGAQDIVLPIQRGELLVGRRDDTRDIHPEIALDDPGASRRHAKLVIEPDGGVALQDLASTNGTRINGQEVPPGTRRRLADGDHVTLGRWTRIALRGRR